MLDKAMDAKLHEIRGYIDKSRAHHKGILPFLSLKELLALGKFAQHECFDAVLLSYSYGWAKGFREAKGLRLDTPSEPISPDDAEILELAKSLDSVQLCAALTTAKELAAVPAVLAHIKGF